MPADHRRGLDDEEHLCETPTVEHPAERGEDRAVGLGEVRTLDLTLKNDELMAHEDLSVALITGRGRPMEAREDEFPEGGFTPELRSRVRRWLPR